MKTLVSVREIRANKYKARKSWKLEKDDYLIIGLVMAVVLCLLAHL